MPPVAASDNVSGSDGGEEFVFIHAERVAIGGDGDFGARLGCAVWVESSQRGIFGEWRPGFFHIITLVAGYGAHAADPRHEADQTRLKAGDCIVIDMGCRKDRYCSDMTRTFFCGEPKPEYAAIHALVRQATEAAEAMIHPGVRLCDIDAAARDLITKAGYGEYFNHRLGHFIGQTDHEKGDVSAANTDTVKPGMIFSIEPGVYLPGKFGVRVEDLVIVTETGCEVLNHVDKHWSVVGV